MIKKKSKVIVKKIEKPKAIKNFNSVNWVREVRDKMAEKNKDSDIHDYVKKITSGN